jgi:hypothetical protein
MIIGPDNEGKTQIRPAERMPMGLKLLKPHGRTGKTPQLCRFLRAMAHTSRIGRPPLL